MSDDIQHRFTNHPPSNDEVASALDALTARFIELGEYLEQMLPPGRELALALTQLEQCSMWSKAAVARNQ